MEDGIAETLTDQLRGWADGAVEALPRVGVAFALLLVTWLVVRSVRWSIARLGRRFRQNLVEVLQLVATVGLWLFGALAAVTVVFPTITPANALATLGLGSVAIGFAFKDTFENFLAGILILLREPFRIGDFVEADGIEGRIESITIRDSRIRQTDGQLVVVPNHVLFREPVTVRTDRDVRRVSITAGVSYGEDVDRAREVITAALHGLSLVDESRGVEVYAASFNSSSIDFTVRWWAASTPIDLHRSRDQVVAAIKRALDEANIEIPFPYRTLTFKEPLSLTRADAEAP